MNNFTKKNILFFKLLITIITSTSIFCKCNCNCCCKNKNNTTENKTNNTFSIIPKQKEKIKLEEDKKKKENEIIEKEKQEQIKKEEEKIKKLDEEKKRKEDEERKRKEEEAKKRKEAAERIKKEEEERKRKEEEERKRKEEEERKRKLEEEKKRKLEEEKIRKLEEERKRKEEGEIKIYDKFPTNKYENKEEIGKGIYGKVYKCHDMENNIDVAIKEGNEEEITEFELKSLKKLHHINIIEAYDTFKVKNMCYIVMEICCNKNLQQIINKPVITRHSDLIFYQLINGLEYLHNLNIIHCDIKPANILFSKKFILKIADFGSSFYLNDKKDHNIRGTLFYLPPELLKAYINKTNGYNTYESDIWSCGMLLYNILTKGKALNSCKTNEDLLNELNNIEKYINNLPEDTDKDAIDLLKRILVVDQEKRITIDKIKKHPFYLRGEKDYKESIKNQ